MVLSHSTLIIGQQSISTVCQLVVTNLTMNGYDKRPQSALNDYNFTTHERSSRTKSSPSFYKIFYFITIFYYIFLCNTLNTAFLIFFFYNQIALQCQFEIVCLSMCFCTCACVCLCNGQQAASSQSFHCHFFVQLDYTSRKSTHLYGTLHYKLVNSDSTLLLWLIKGHKQLWVCCLSTTLWTFGLLFWSYAGRNITF